MNHKQLTLIFIVLLLPVISNGKGLLSYKPPLIGSPSAFTGGGTRSLEVKKLQVLAPKHTALTSQSQPVLYWYSYLNKKQKIQFTLLKAGTDQPTLQKQLDLKSAGGLHSINLAEYGISLQAGEEYSWSVGLKGDADSATDGTSGKLVYQVPGSSLVTVEQQAEAGYWYDALQQLIESHSPLVNDLLEQGELKIPAL
jgi:hypothetical protein